MLENERLCKSTKRKLKRMEYSKRMTTVILTVALIDIQLTYVLAFMGREIAETLSITLVTEVVAVFGGYLIKAFFGKKEEEKNKLIRNNEEDADV